MRVRSCLRPLAVASLLMLGALGAGVTPILASAPSNDDWAHATSVGSLPATVHGDNTDATAEADDPSDCGDHGFTVWYRFTPTTNMAVLLDLKGSSIKPVISVWKGSTLAGCITSPARDSSPMGSRWPARPATPARTSSRSSSLPIRPEPSETGAGSTRA